jgi:hypothetical protein
MSHASLLLRNLLLIKSGLKRTIIQAAKRKRKTLRLPAKSSA